MHGEAENIISMEKFYPMLKSTKCAADHMTLNFENKRSYKYGRRIWHWVNGADERTFVMVAGLGHCGWNGDRLPFIVSNAHFDDISNAVTLVGRVSDWKTVAHTYEIYLGGHHALAKRDFQKSFSVPFTHPYPGHNEWGSGDVKFTYDCNGCGTTGDFEMDLSVQGDAWNPTAASVTIRPQGVAANFNPALGLTAQLAGSDSQEFTLLTIPIDHVGWKGVLDLGPDVVFSVGYTVGPLTGTADIGTEMSLSLQDGAELTLDLLSPGASASGWTPSFNVQPLTVNATISGSAQLNLKAAVALTLDVFGKSCFGSPSDQRADR